TFIADEKFAEIARTLGLPCKNTEEGVKSLVKAIRDLMKEINVPMTIKECGVDETEYMSKIADLADKAFGDQCTGANPRMPLVTELEEIYRKAYNGK
ncbi:MAG: iron-containing alcohol dehydrogenase, partial [Oscillospiraceae bacterium]